MQKELAMSKDLVAKLQSEVHESKKCLEHTKAALQMLQVGQARFVNTNVQPVGLSKYSDALFPLLSQPHHNTGVRAQTSKGNGKMKCSGLFACKILIIFNILEKRISK